MERLLQCMGIPILHETLLTIYLHLLCLHELFEPQIEFEEFYRF